MKRYKDRPPETERHYVCNRSSRRGAPILAVAVHSTESNDLKGTRDDLRAIRGWFDNPASQASSHIGVDGDGNSEVWVPAEQKAWTILDLNPVTLNIEFIGRAAQPERAWETAQLKVGAKWAAYWCIRFGIPAQRGNVRNVNGQAVVSRKGIITHFDLTRAGFGSHTDPGPGFPMDDFIRYVQWFRRNGWFLKLTDNDIRNR